MSEETHKYFNKWVKEKDRRATCMDSKFRMITFAKDYSDEVIDRAIKRLDDEKFNVRRKGEIGEFNEVYNKGIQKAIEILKQLEK